VLYDCLGKQIPESAASWLDDTLHKLSEKPSETFLFTQFSATHRWVGKADLKVNPENLEIAHALRTGWKLEHWSIDQATRIVLLLSFPADHENRYVQAIERLFAAADVSELVALCQALPLYPYPERFVDRAINGLRTSIDSVFNAIALNNPFPADYFDEAAWNQMVLKALFVDSRLSEIQGLDRRANPKLARMLSDYAHERWAAGRSVNPQLWRSLGPFAEGELVADLERVLQSHDPSERQAGALACASAPVPEAQALLETVPELKQPIASGQLTWQSFSVNHP
jgi:hypothetical protein